MKILWALVYGDHSIKKGEMEADPVKVLQYVLTQVDDTKPAPVEVHLRIKS